MFKLSEVSLCALTCSQRTAAHPHTRAKSERRRVSVVARTNARTAALLDSLVAAGSDTRPTHASCDCGLDGGGTDTDTKTHSLPLPSGANIRDQQFRWRVLGSSIRSQCSEDAEDSASVAAWDCSGGGKRPGARGADSFAAGGADSQSPERTWRARASSTRPSSLEQEPGARGAGSFSPLEAQTPSPLAESPDSFAAEGR